MPQTEKLHRIFPRGHRLVCKALFKQLPTEQECSVAEPKDEEKSTCDQGIVQGLCSKAQQEQ